MDTLTYQPSDEGGRAQLADQSPVPLSQQFAEKYRCHHLGISLSSLFPPPLSMEVMVVTSSKDTGAAAIDIQTGVSHVFKDCLAESGTLTLIGNCNSYSGSGSSDYLAVAQTKKPVIHIWQWGKAQVLMQCHQQEIITALCADPTGNFMVGGSKTGRIYIWNLSDGNLLYLWQAHFKTITRLKMNCRGGTISTVA